MLVKMIERGMKTELKRLREATFRASSTFFTLFYVQLMALLPVLAFQLFSSPLAVFFEFSWAASRGAGSEEWMKNSRMWDTY
jgi:hypothetical protein